MIATILSALFGGESNTPAIAHYEVKQYAGNTLQNTWNTAVVHETAHGYAFVDLATNQPVTVSGNVKITGIIATATDATAAQ